MNRKVTVSMSIRFCGMQTDSTDAAIEIIRGVLATGEEACQAEIRQALADAGAKDVVITMAAY